MQPEIPKDPPGRILFADDEEIFLLSTADLLRAEGFLVDCARDGLAARRLLETQSYDLLISDINMPGNPELGLLKEVPEANAGIPVILVTGYPSAQTAIQAIDLNVLTYLVKPLEFSELLERTREGIRQRRVQRAIQDSSARVQDWASEMAQLAKSLRQARAPAPVSVQQMLGMVLGRVGETMLDLKHLVEITASGPGEERDLCLVQHCPRLELYERVIREGIDTLERTKGSFKSKELGDLRHRLEQTVSGSGLE